jgi:outer membrane protein OmpA-like peptidoglycan-associated protein
MTRSGNFRSLRILRMISWAVFCQMSRRAYVFSRTSAGAARRRPRGSALLLAAGAVLLTAAADAPAATTAAAVLPPPLSRALRRELDRAEAQLRASIAPLEAGQPVQILREPGRVVLRIPARSLFDAESTIPRGDAAARALLLAARQVLRARGRLAGLIEVHTDGIGGREANLQFSEQRADALRAWFTEEGVPARRLRTAARGVGEPLASDEAPEGRMQNRRIELVFEPVPAS